MKKTQIHSPFRDFLEGIQNRETNSVYSLLQYQRDTKYPRNVVFIKPLKHNRNFFFNTKHIRNSRPKVITLKCLG